MPRSSPRPRSGRRADGRLGPDGPDAKAIKEKAPDLAERVNAGKMSVHRADREMASRRGPVVKLFDEPRPDEIATDDDGQHDVADGDDRHEVAPTIAAQPAAPASVEDGATERYVAERLGDTVEMIHETYGHVTAKMRVAAVERLAKRLRRPVVTETVTARERSVSELDNPAVGEGPET